MSRHVDYGCEFHHIYLFKRYMVWPRPLQHDYAHHRGTTEPADSACQELIRQPRVNGP